jgi:acetyl-CoA carboxylase carboxyl transferase subunit alpha
MGIIDSIVPEPAGGAHTDHEEASRLLGIELRKALTEVQKLDVRQMLDARYEKFRKMAQFFKEE